MKSRVDNPIAYFSRLGGLHDARITCLSWSQPSSQLKLTVDDLNSNFLGLPEYEGHLPATLSFDHVENLSTECTCLIDNGRPVAIFDLVLSRTKKGFTVRIDLAPGGYIGFDCVDMAVEDLSEH